MTITWLLAPYNSVFAAAFVVLLCFAVLEGISLLLGLGISDFLSDLLGLSDAPDVAGVADAPEAGAGPGSLFLAWLEVGKIPLLVSVCAFLAAFSIGGMLLQQLLVLAGIPPLAPWLAGGAMFVAVLPVLKLSNRFLGKIAPRDETSSFDPEQLIGRVGIVTIGTAHADRAAEIKVTGPDGRSHYVMVFASDESVPQGGEILLQRRDAATGNFHGRRNDNPDLSPTLYH